MLDGQWGDDVLDGGLGDDYLEGGYGGSDRYLFGFGFGRDTVQEDSGTAKGNDGDAIWLAAGVTEADVLLTRAGDDLVLTLAGGADSMTVQGHFAGASVETLRFAEGVSRNLLTDYLFT